MAPHDGAAIDTNVDSTYITLQLSDRSHSNNLLPIPRP